MTWANLYSILGGMDAALAEVMRKHPLLHGISRGDRAGRESSARAGEPVVRGTARAGETVARGQARTGDAAVGRGGSARGVARAGDAAVGRGSAPADGLPVVQGLRELLPGGALARGSVVQTPDFGLLSLALVAGASAAGGWLGLAGLPELGVLAAADLGVDTERTLLVPRLAANWPQVVSSLLDGCEIVLLRTPEPPRADQRRRFEAGLRHTGGVLVVVGGWPGAQLRLEVTQREWSGLGEGHGRLRACRAEVVVSGRGAAARTRSGWLWLPGEDGGVAAAEPLAAGPALRAVRAG